MTTSLLFISGAGLPSWIWDSVRQTLNVPTAVAPRPTAAKATVTDYATAALNAAPEGPLIVVAHSAGGVIASELVQLAPKRVIGLLVIAAVIPAAGGSFASSLPFPNRLILPAIMRVAGTRPPESSIRKVLAAGLEAAQVERLIADFVPEPRSFFTSRVSAGAGVASLPSTYVMTTDDEELPARVQRGYTKRLGQPRVVELLGGHLPMLGQPAALAAVIAEFIALGVKVTR